jgi:Tc toxin complex TcA C-terminal TcB-binding domain
MHLEQNGHWLRCEPPESVPAGVEVALDVEVGPVDGPVRVEAVHRVGDRSGRSVTVLQPEDRPRDGGLRLLLPAFADGDAVEVTLAAWFGDQRLPESDGDDASTFRIAITAALIPAAAKSQDRGAAKSQDRGAAKSQDRGAVAERAREHAERIATRRAHASLATLAVSRDDRTNLIAAGYADPAAVAVSSRAAFVAALHRTVAAPEANRIHAAARVQEALLGTESIAYRMTATRSVDGMNVDCGCADCQAATSPVAYLSDLLVYAEERLRLHDDPEHETEIHRASLAELLRQPFDALPLDCDASSREVSHVRLTIESLAALWRDNLAVGVAGTRPDLAVSPLPHRITYMFAADVDGDRSQELVVGFDFDASSWLAPSDVQRSGFWVLKYDLKAKRWRHLAPADRSSGAAMLLPSGVRVKHGFAARFRADPLGGRADRQHLVLALEEPGQPGTRFWILQYEPKAAGADAVWTHLLPTFFHVTGGDAHVPLADIGGAFAADIDGDGLDELVAYGVAPAVGGVERNSAFWVYDLQGGNWAALSPTGSTDDVAFVCDTGPYQVRLVTTGDLDQDGRDEIVAIPAAPGGHGRDPWIMHFDAAPGQWSHLSPTGLPPGTDARVAPGPWPTKHILAGTVTGVSGAELLAAPQPVTGADQTRFSMLTYQPARPDDPTLGVIGSGPTFDEIDGVDCSTASLPVDLALLADVDGDGHDELVVTTRSGGRYGGWVMDHDGGWHHLSPIAGHPLGADFVWGDGTVPAPFLTASDVDGDGQQELVVASTTGNLIWVLKFDRAARTWGHLSPIDTTELHGRYAFAAYQALLVQLGTDYEEVRRERGGTAADRQALAERIGVSLGSTRPDQLDKLVLDPSDITPERVEELFGLASTRRDPLADGPVDGTRPEQVVRWTLSGARWSADPDSATTAAEGTVHLGIQTIATGRVRVRAYRDPALVNLVASGEGDPTRPILLQEESGSGLHGTVTLGPGPYANGPVLRVFPQVAVWRWQGLRAQWDAEDQPGDPYDTGAKERRPVVDPDLIGPDDFRCPVAKPAAADPDAAFDLWLRRRDWLDGKLTALRALGEDITALFDALRPGPGAAPAGFPWRDAPSDVDALVAVLTGGTLAEVTAATTTVREKLHLPVDAFLRLMALRAGPPANAADWTELRAILVLAFARDAYPAWIAEEGTAKVRLDAATFVGTAPAPATGAWQHEPVPAADLLGGQVAPLVDPDRVALTDLPVGVAGAAARRIWRQRVAALAANLAAVHAASGPGPVAWEAMLGAALGPVPAGQPSWAQWVLATAAALSDGDPTVAANAVAAARDAALTVPGLRRLAVLGARLDAGATLTPQQRADAESVLAAARKIRVLYPTWLAEEHNATRPLPYWRARRLVLERWRADPADRQVWLAALARRSQPGVVDPDMVPESWLVNDASKADRRRRDRKVVADGRGYALRQILTRTPNLSTVDAAVREALWPATERTRIRADVSARRAATSGADVVEEILGRNAGRLTGLRTEIDAGGAGGAEARRIALAELGFASERDLRDLLDTLAKAPGRATAAELARLDDILTDLTLLGGLVRADTDSEDLGQRLADRAGALGLDPAAWRRLVAVRLVAVAGGPVLPAEQDDLEAIGVRLEKLRRYGQWRAEELADGIRLGPDSFVRPAGFEPGVDDPAERPWRVSRAELTRWRETLAARADQHARVRSALADAVVRVEDATLPMLRDDLVGALPVPGTAADAGARWAADHLLVDIQQSGCRRTTRVAHAIEVVLALLWSVRTGQLRDTYPRLTLDAPTFDEDWRWIGSYATWRSAMLVHLYPENLVRPSLRRYRSPAYDAALDDLRGADQLSLPAARRIAAAYGTYFSEVCRLDLDRMVCAQVNSAYTPVMLVRGSGQPRACDLYLATSTASKRVYWALREPTSDTRYELSFWHPLDQFGTNEVVALVGLVPYRATNDPAGRRWLYAFAIKQTIEGKSLVFLRYDLDTATWEQEPTPLDPPPGVTEFNAWLYPTPPGQPPKVGIESHFTTPQGQQQTTLMSRSLNAKGTGWEQTGFALVDGYGRWQPLGGTGTAAAPATGAAADYAATAITVRAVLAGDVDGDGRDELVLVPNTAAAAVVFRYDPATKAWSAMPRPTTAIPVDAHVTLGRFSSGTRAEIVHMRRMVGSRAVLHRYDSASRSWTSEGAAGWQANRGVGSITAGDFDGDGLDELAVSPALEDQTFALLPVNGYWILGTNPAGGLAIKSGLTTVEPQFDFRIPADAGERVAFRCSPLPAHAGLTVAGDFDGDGRDELGAALAPEGPAAQALSRGNDWWVIDLRAGSRAWAALGAPDAAHLHRVLSLSDDQLSLLAATTGDVDGDGRAEIVALPEAAGPGTRLMFADFRPGPVPTDPAVQGTWATLPELDLSTEQIQVDAVVAGDFDGDGTDELLLVGNGKIWLRKYDLPSGAWVEFTSTGLPGANEQPTFGFAVKGRFTAPTGPEALALHPGALGVVLQTGIAGSRQKRVVGSPTGTRVLTREFLPALRRPAPCRPPVALAPTYPADTRWAFDDTVPPPVRRELSARVLADNAGRPATVQRYLWEAFYDLPMAVALALQESQAYNHALDWFRLSYDYTAVLGERKAFAGLVADEQGKPEQAEAQPWEYARLLLDWVRDPLDPHAIAAVRPHTYTRGTVQLLVQCLLDYADAEFSRDTGESIERARILYETARELLGLPVLNQRLGGCPDIIAEVPPATTLGQAFAAGLAARYHNHRNVLGNAAVTAGAMLVGSLVDGPLPWFAQSRTTAMFCVSPNPMLAALRLHAELNLYKIRTCRNIAGMRRELEVYAAATDQVSGMPMIGADGELLVPPSRPATPTPYRYVALVEQARRLAGQARDTEAQLLSALEKRDAEAATLLRARQDVAVTRSEVRLQELRVHEAEDRVSMAQLQQQRAAVEEQHYADLLAAGENVYEQAALGWLQQSMAYQMMSAVMNQAAAHTQGGVAADYFYAEMYPMAWSAVAGAMSSTAAAFSSLAAYSSTYSQWNSMQAGLVRTRQDWQLRRALAGYDRMIAGQQMTLERDGVRIAEQERTVRQLQADHAEQLLEFQQSKFSSVELYDWLAGVLSRTYRWFLQQATAMAQLAAQQLAFEGPDGQPPPIRGDYWTPPTTGLAALGGPDSGPDRRGLTGAERLLRDLAELDQYAFTMNQRKLQLSRTLSLAQLAPLELQRLRETGVMTFATPSALFDRDFPGHYLRMIRKVTVSVIALTPPAEGVRATLTSGGLSRVVVGPDVFRPVVVRHQPESVALTAPIAATGTFVFEPASGLRDPFEGLGVDTTWELRLPRPANPFDFSTLADVLIAIDYTALDSADYRARVVRGLDRTAEGDRGFSLRGQFPDAWWGLHNPDQTATPLKVGFSTVRTDFPPNLDELTITHIAVYLVADDVPAAVSTVSLKLTAAEGGAKLGGAATPVDRIVSTRRGNGGPWLSITGRAPVGAWELAFPDSAGDEVRDWLAAGGLTDVLLVVSYRGRTPAWPA